MASQALRVVVDARAVSGETGGVEGVLIGLAHGLSRMDGPEEYIFAVWPGHELWLEPYLSGPARMVVQDFSRSGRSQRIARAREKVRSTLERWRGDASQVGNRPTPRRDTFVEELEPHVVHLPIQRGFLATVPSIYHPHDLQHVHLPQFFTDEDREWRENVYASLCRRAALVAVASEWTRADVTAHFDLPEEKVRVVPLAPPLAASRDASPDERHTVRERFNLPAAYILYPAQTWPHKNHAGLLRALATLRDRDGLVVPLVASGTQNEHFQAIAEESRRLGLENQVTWTGFVAPVELQALFAGARAVVIPTLFEAASGPLWEAFQTGIAAACSNVTSLPEQAGDAAIVFNPANVGEMAAAIGALWRDEGLRRTLVAAGRRQVATLSWEATARAFRSHYRRLAGAPMTDDDRSLVAAGA